MFEKNYITQWGYGPEKHPDRIIGRGGLKGGTDGTDMSFIGWLVIAKKDFRVFR